MLILLIFFGIIMSSIGMSFEALSLVRHCRLNSSPLLHHSHAAARTPSLTATMTATTSLVNVPSAGVCLCMHAYMHTCMHTRIHAYTYLHTYLNTYLHTRAHMYLYIHTHACLHTYAHPYIHTCGRTYMHAYMHIIIHLCIY